MKVSSLCRKELEKRKNLYFRDDKSNRFIMLHQDESIVFPVSVFTNNDDETVMTVGYVPQIIPPEFRLSVSEYFTRVNYRLKIGSFDFNLENGSIIFRVFVDMEDGKLSGTMLNYMMTMTFLTVPKYYEGLIKILFHGFTPDQAYYLIQKNDENNADGEPGTDDGTPKDKDSIDEKRSSQEQKEGDYDEFKL